MFIELIIILLIVYFWPRLCSFLSKNFLPWAKETFGEKIGGMLETLIIWLDRGIRGVRRGIKQAWAFFKERVLRLDTVYLTTNGRDVSVETTARVNIDGKRYIDITESSNMPMDNLPLKIQEEIIRQQKNALGIRHAECNELNVLKQQAKSRLEEDKKQNSTPEEELDMRELCTLVNE